MDFFEEPKVKVWISKVLSNGCKINSIEPLQQINKKNGELLFALCRTDISTPAGGKLPSIIMIRGDVVVVVPLIRNIETGEESFLMVKQYRIGTGGAMELEFPAGMLDRNTGDPVGVAVEEVKEETGLSIKRGDLFALSDTLLYSSPGLHDEGVNYYGCVIELPGEMYKKLEGSSAGSAAEGETTLVTLKTKNELVAQTHAAQVLLALFLFENHVRTFNKNR